MGRFTSVQAYADNNKNMRAVSYEQATAAASTSTSSEADRKSSVKTEKVVNPYGSAAGAGSGEFHLYRHARAREAARWEALGEEEKEKKLKEEFQKSIEMNQEEEDRKTAQRRKKRQRQKEAKLRKKNLALAGVKFDEGEQKKDSLVDEEEFTYAPMEKLEESQIKDEGKLWSDKASFPFANDGSFLEMAKKKLEEDKKRRVGSDDREQPPAKKLATEKGS